MADLYINEPFGSKKSDKKDESGKAISALKTSDFSYSQTPVPPDEIPSKPGQVLINEPFGGMGEVKEQNMAPIEEMHPDISNLDRAFIKNMGRQPGAVYNYLKSRYPELQIVTTETPSIDPQTGKRVPQKNGGRIFIRSKEDIAKGIPARVLDPRGWQGWGEFGKDATDVVVDTIRGAATLGAGALTGVGVAALNPAIAPVTAPLSAAAAAGTVGTGLDLLTQKAGQWVGIPQDIDYEGALESGAMDAAGTLLFGSGGSAARVGKEMLKRYGEKKAGELMTKYPLRIEMSQQGLPGMAYTGITHKFGPKLGEIVSGVDQDLIRTVKEKGKKVDEYSQSNRADLYRGKSEEVKEALGKKKDNIIEAEDDIYGSMTGQIELAPVKQGYLDYEKKLKSLYQETKAPVYKERLAQVRFARKNYFPSKEYIEHKLPITGESVIIAVPPPKTISLKAANDLKRLVKEDQAQYAATTGERLRDPKLRGSGVDTQIGNISRGVIREINDQMDRATGGATAEVRKKWETHFNTVNEFDKSLGNPEDLEKSLLKARGPATRQFQENLMAFDKKYNLDLMKTAEIAQAERQFSNNPYFARSQGGTPATGRIGVVGLLGGAAGSRAGQETWGGPGSGTVGSMIGASLGLALASPKSLKSWMKVGKGIKTLLSPNAEGPVQLPYSLMLRQFMKEDKSGQ